MRFEHIISTMHRENADFLLPERVRHDVLVVNQCDTEKVDTFTVDGNHVRMISNFERGLSNSRNALLRHAEGDICILGDDDLVYVDGYDAIIEKAYKDYPQADIICFRFALDENMTPRPHFEAARKIGMFQISKIASVEVTFKRDSVQKAHLQFCPLLGVGAEFGSGEENAFLADALRAGLNIQYVPKTICYLQETPEERVKWQNGFDKDYFIKRGACFYRIYKAGFLPFTVAFLLLKKRNLFRNVPIFSAFHWMLMGKREFKRLSKGEKECL